MAPQGLFSHPQLPEILDSLLEGFQLIGPDFKYLYLNEAAALQGRSTREQLIGRTMMEAYPGIENTPMFALLRDSMVERRAHRLENEFMYPDGQKGWFELRFEPTPQGVLILSVEISEQKRGEEALRRSTRALSTLSDCNQSLVRATDELSFMQDVCRAAVERSGYRMAWVGFKEQNEAHSIRPIASSGMDQGYTDSLRVSWDESVTGRGPTGRAVRTGQVVIARVLASDPDFEPWRQDALARGYASSIALPFNIRGEVAGALSIYSAEPDAFDEKECALLTELALDLGHGLQTLREREAAKRELDERLRAEERITGLNQRLKASEDRYRSLVENLEDVVFTIDAGGIVTYTSPAIRRYGYTPSEAVGGPFVRFVRADDVAELEESFRRALAGQVETRVFRVHDKSGKERVVRTTSRVVMADDRAVGISGLLIDITELKRTEEQLRLAQKMEAIGQLAGGVAHDFNNLLSVILSYAAFMSDALHDGDPLRADLEEIQKAGESAAQLTHQLLAFSRKQVLEPKVLELNALATNLEKMLRRLIGEDIELVQKLTPDLGRVKADPGQLEQVIMNLVVNARDAMPQGGKLTIETKNVELDADYESQHASVKPGLYAMLAISDSGCGMDETTKQRLFEPFFTTKGIGKGTGLGLSTVYGIIEQSGGTIWVYSEIGVGTTFKIYLPRVSDPMTTTATRRESDRPARGDETILLVEDDPPVRALSERILRAEGYQVLTAANGGEALLLCEMHPGEIHLLLTAVVMPQMSGRQLASRLAQLKPQLKVLYMSGYTDNAIEHHGVLERGMLFISKPFVAKDLARKVRDALDTMQSAPQR